eukprot:TRINITY_DN756_c1_g3_i1.p1 TRINITY_DN756_c1_g3~~TRINITY_DN756_c1_g3_i1.p1  ORF type:complete len:294 (-),score=33.55 TRINITY_DN756_c1_g3_i1:653-1534(-)
MGDQANTSSRAISMSCRLLVLLLVGAGVVTLVGLAFTGIEGFFMGGLQSNVKQLEQNSEDLEQQNLRFKQNIKMLNKQLKNLTNINHSLEDQVELFYKQNQRLEESCSSLNETDTELNSSVERMKTINVGLEYQVDKFQNETEDLGDAVSQLQQLSNHLKQQLTDFQEVQEVMAQNSVSDFAEVIKLTQDMYSTEVNMAFNNQETLMQNIAMRLEFSNDEEGFTHEEFDACIEHFSGIAQISSTTLYGQFNFDLEKGFDGLVNYKSMSQIIKDVVSLAQQPWQHGTNTLLVVA